MTSRVRDTAAATAVINASPATAAIDLVTLKPYLSEVMYDNLIHYPETELNASECYNPDDDICKPVILTVMGIGVEGFLDPDENEHIVDVKRVIQRNKSTMFNNSEILPNKRTLLPYLKEEVVRYAKLISSATIPKPKGWTSARCIGWLKNNLPLEIENDVILKAFRLLRLSLREHYLAMS